MDFETEIMSLKKLVQEQQSKISDLEDMVNRINGELAIVSDEMNYPGKNGYPSFYDAKEKLIEKGWLKKPSK